LVQTIDAQEMIQEEFEMIRKKIRQKKAFYLNVIFWLTICIALVVSHLLAGIELFWFLVFFLGWGAVILVHYFTLFGIPFLSQIGKKWEEEQFEKEITRKALESTEKDEQLELKELRKNYRDEDFV
jgi:hypothetical protein